jgi:hypothetical protein
MKKHKKLIIVFIIIILLLVAITVFFIIKNKNESLSNSQNSDMPEFSKDNMQKGDIGNFEQSSDKMSNKDNSTKNTTITSTAEIESSLTEKIELHTTYYLEEVNVEENEFVAEGENILKYTNGTYLVAPYDCYIISLNLPDLEGKVLNSHYIQISSANSLMTTMNIDETNIDRISVGSEATIKVTSLGKTYTGYITHIASTGKSGKYEIEVEFENDGDAKLGMTAEVSIIIK